MAFIVNRKVTDHKIKIKRLVFKIVTTTFTIFILGAVGYIGVKTWPGSDRIIIAYSDYSCELTSCSYGVKVRNSSREWVSGYLRVYAYVTPQKPYLTAGSSVRKTLIASQKHEFEIDINADYILTGNIEGPIQPDQLSFSVGVRGNKAP